MTVDDVLPFTIPVVESLVNVPVFWPPPRHLLHVALGNQLLELRDLPHPVKDPPPGHIEDLGRCVLTVLLGEESNL